MDMSGQLYKSAALPRGKDLSTRCTERWMGPIAGLGTVAKTKNPLPVGNRPSFVLNYPGSNNTRWPVEVTLFLVCSVLNRSVTSCPLGPNIFLILFPEYSSLFSVEVRNHFKFSGWMTHFHSSFFFSLHSEIISMCWYCFHRPAYILKDYHTMYYRYHVYCCHWN
jgi:hypothetical protein